MGYCNFVWKQTWIISIIPVCVHCLYRGKSPNPTTPQGKVAAPPGQQQPSPASPRLVHSGPLPASSLPQPLTPQSTPSAQSMPGSKVQYYTALGLNISLSQFLYYLTDAWIFSFLYLQPSVTASFTPTSVIRKMHSDKASEKEKQRGDGPRMEGADGKLCYIARLDHFQVHITSGLWNGLST